MFLRSSVLCIQRDVVWNSAKQGHLIDSLVKNYYVPPVIFSIRPAENGEDIRVAIDGKQRLTSIHRFMEGEIPQIDSTNNDRVWYKKSRDCKSKRGRIMDRSERDEFNKKFQICVQYRGLNEEQEQEIFRRVQLGVALSTAERLFARPGPLADFARELVKTYDELLSIFDAKRKLGFQVLVQVILVIWYKPDKIPSAVNVDKEIKKGEPVDNKARVLVECVLDVFQTLVKEHSDVFQHPVRLAPIEFVMIAYLIAMRDEEPIEVLRDDVVVLRENTRKKFIDIRSNQRLYQFMKDHIDSLVMQ
ncbi:hypothetical protein DFJ77DRAFT_37325 [Powellomyces hirtus]|nr:hypothetical protein DFJ77DRAFT_37325 [Powellomyces hirtus]